VTSGAFLDAQQYVTLRVMPEEQDDTQLMLRYCAGDVRAFEHLYARHKSALYRYLKQLCGGAELANDVFQEVWSKVIDARDDYQVRAQFRTWLFRIAHNCAVDHLRRANRLSLREIAASEGWVEQFPDADHEQPDALLSQAEVQAALQLALSTLPHEQREVFVLYEESGLGLQEIAQITQVNMETAKSRLRYALNKLRKALSQHQPAEPRVQQSLAAVTQEIPT
jgi:RNA polymerase sigma-70 factor, ECF subfamily